jgi:hypothetical protein
VVITANVATMRPSLYYLPVIAFLHRQTCHTSSCTQLRVPTCLICSHYSGFASIWLPVAAAAATANAFGVSSRILWYVLNVATTRTATNTFVFLNRNIIHYSEGERQQETLESFKGLADEIQHNDQCLEGELAGSMEDASKVAATVNSHGP